MTAKLFKKVQAHVQAMKFEGTYESGMEICKWIGGGSRYIPDTKTDPFKYVQVPTMFGPRDIEEGYWVVKIEAGSFLPYKEEALFAEYSLVEDEEKALVKHARAELALFPNEDANFLESIINGIKGFSEYEGHSDSSAAIAIHMMSALLRGENLLPLTNDPEEWELRAGSDYGLEEDMWQNLRNSKAISKDGGATYFLVGEENATKDGDPIMHTSQDKDYAPEIDPEDLKSDDEKAAEEDLAEVEAILEEANEKTED